MPQRALRTAITPGLGRWLIRQPNGRLKINTAKVNTTKVKAEAGLDGTYLIATSDPQISAMTSPRG